MRRLAMFALTIAGGALAVSCSHEEPYHAPLTPVRVQLVEPASGSGVARYSATIEPRSRVDLAFKVPGYIESLANVDGRTIQDGDRVSKGMVLARIRTSDFDERVILARSQLSEAEAAATAARAAYERASALFKVASLTRPEYEQAQATFDAMQAKLAGARALVQQAQNARTDSVLTSPIDGIVLKRLIEVGSLVGAGTGGFVLADVSSVKAVFGAPDTVLTMLKVGDTVPVTSEAVPNRQFNGRISNIAPTADPASRVFGVELTIPNSDGALKVGMVAVAASDPRRQGTQSQLVVPLTAIVRSKDTPGGYAVYVVDDTGGKAVVRVRNVTLGDLIGNEIAVASGVRQGEKVVVSGATIVTDGEAVSLVL